MKREVLFPSFSSYFKADPAWNSLTEIIHYNHHLFNKVSVIFITSLIIAFLGFFNTYFFMIAGANLTLLLINYLSLKHISKKIFIRRSFPQKSKEYTKISVKYNIENRSSFKINSYEIIDHFEGIKKFDRKLDLPKKISNNQRVNHLEHYVLDNGMGVKKFQEINILIRDPLDLFKAVIKFTYNDKIKVRPKIEKIPNIMTSAVKDSIYLGKYSLPVRGDSTNFIGTREYRNGDNFKFINWKLTSKGNKVILNEFEKYVNSHISIILNTDKRAQMGEGSMSTIEYMKDLSLSLASSYAQDGNQLQFISNNWSMPLSQGANQLEYLELLFCYLKLKEERKVGTLIQRHLDLIPKGSTIIFITPLNFDLNLKQELKTLKKISTDHNTILCIFLDGYDYLIKNLSGEIKAILHEKRKNCRTSLHKTKLEYKNSHIKFLKLDIQNYEDMTLNQQLRIELKKNKIYE